VLNVRWKVNCKVRPVAWHEGAQREYSYNSTLSLTSAPDEGVRLTPHPGNFTHGNDPVPIVLLGPQGRTGQVRKFSPPPGFDPRTVRPLVSRFPGPHRALKAPDLKYGGLSALRIERSLLLLHSFQPNNDKVYTQHFCLHKSVRRFDTLNYLVFRSFHWVWHRILPKNANSFLKLQVSTTS